MFTQAVTELESPSSPMTPAETIVHEDLSYITSRGEQEFAQLSGRHVVVAGGAGFLGHYLVQAMLHWNRTHERSKPISVTVLDSFVRDVPPWLTALRSTPHLQILQHDVTTPFPAGLGDIQYVIHAASIASPIYYRKYPIETMDANVNGLRFLLEHCLAEKKKGKAIEGVLFYSSSEIYGDPTPENIPTPETYRGHVSCTGPRACYDESKRYGETLCVNFANQHGLPIKVARPFNNYGPGLKITDGRVIPDFARNILAGEDIVILSDGTAKRTFCYVADAVLGYFKVLVRGGAGEAYNVGVETPEISVMELADRVVALGKELFDYRGRVVRKTSVDKDYLVDNPVRRCPVITKARTELGFDPQILIDEGLRRSLVWYSGNRHASEA
jgi:UDP-glucuronate decarboxylase